jgi:hypothetical protein
MEFNLDGKVFRSHSNTENGEVGKGTVFQYYQKEDVVWADYDGGVIVKGHLVANMLSSGNLDMSYHHISRNGEVMIGKCISTPEIMSDGKIRFKEYWQWLSGNMSSGYSEIIEE